MEAAGVRARLDVDADRDGTIGEAEPGRDAWEWGPDGRGPIVAVDTDLDGLHPDDAATIRLTVEGTIPDGLEVLLSINDLAAQHVTLWSVDGDSATAIAGALAEPRGRPLSDPVRAGARELLLQAHYFADGAFDALVQVFVEIRQSGAKKGMLLDRVLFRVAPWIMPTPLDAPEQVYVVAEPDPRRPDTNLELLTVLEQAAADLRISPTVEIPAVVIEDIWIQDEIEFGYSQVPPATMRHVVVDGPRNRQLDTVAEQVIADEDVGFYEIAAQQKQESSLDSFGNLEVAPPTEGYPLGRIVLGTKRRLDADGRRMSLEVRQFLYGQLVQPVLEIYSDWLFVGHVDEFLSFEPDPDREHGFRILLASPASFRRVLEAAQADGHGAAELWSGRERRRRDGTLVDAAESIDELLAKEKLWAYNAECDAVLAEIRADLLEGLGLDEDDVFEVPVGFRRADDDDLDGEPDVPGLGRRALAYFPDMVNHLILGPISIVPRPYGPQIEGVDLLEKALVEAVGHSRDVRFADDWVLYHENLGEIHCGTNVRRTPPSLPPWWKTRPARAYDARMAKP